jgi:hypothetical protein
MKMYRVYIVDKFSRLPLAYHDVLAITKWGAKAKIFKYVCEKDRSYLLFASNLKGRCRQ